MGHDQEKAIEAIRHNIAQHGHHIYVVSGGSDPRFAYTIGLTERLGFELVFAGAIFYMHNDVVRIINEITSKIVSQRSSTAARFELELLGSFSLREIDASWSKLMLLGVLDFYKKTEVHALQIMPDREHTTIDIPDMSKPWDADIEPIWQWLQRSWPYSVSSNSKAITNLAALRGERITEVMRWEEDEWELFAGAGPDVPKDEVRVVSLGTLLAADWSLSPIVNLQLESGLWRDATSEWHPWGQRA